MHGVRHAPIFRAGQRPRTQGLGEGLSIATPIALRAGALARLGHRIREIKSEIIEENIYEEI